MLDSDVPFRDSPQTPLTFAPRADSTAFFGLLDGCQWVTRRVVNQRRDDASDCSSLKMADYARPRDPQDMDCPTQMRRTTTVAPNLPCRCARGPH